MIQFYPEREEQAGNGAPGRIYCSELESIRDFLIAEYAGKVQLVYMDPPFGTGDHFVMRMKQGEGDWKSGNASVTLPAYDDDLPLDEYLAMMRSAISLAHELLSPTGSIFVHCDWHRSAHLRILLDEIFGERNFVNEIIWVYQTGGRSRRHFSRKHDNIFFYRKSSKLFFDSESVSAPRGARDNHLKRHVDSDGRVYRSVRTAGKVYTYYDDEPVPPSDVWDDVSHIQQRDPRRTGYDSQKPGALMERIVKCASREGDLVVDLFCGSASMPAAASRLGRRYLGVDKSTTAMHASMRTLADNPAVFYSAASSDSSWCKAEFVMGIADYVFHINDFEGGLDKIDSWAAGYYIDGAFQSMAAEMRTSQKKGKLTFTLHFPIRMGIPAIRISDTSARQLYFRLEE